MGCEWAVEQRGRAERVRRRGRQRQWRPSPCSSAPCGGCAPPLFPLQCAAPEALPPAHQTQRRCAACEPAGPRSSAAGCAWRLRRAAPSSQRVHPWLHTQVGAVWRGWITGGSRAEISMPRGSKTIAAAAAQRRMQARARWAASRLSSSPSSLLFSPLSPVRPSLSTASPSPSPLSSVWSASPSSSSTPPPSPSAVSSPPRLLLGLPREPL